MDDPLIKKQCFLWTNLPNANKLPIHIPTLYLPLAPTLSPCHVKHRNTASMRASIPSMPVFTAMDH